MGPNESSSSCAGSSGIGVGVGVGGGDDGAKLWQLAPALVDTKFT